MTDPLRKMHPILSCDPSLDLFRKVQAAVAKTAPPARKRLLTICEGALNSQELASSEPTCRACATVLVALLPQSRDAIQSLLASQEPHMFEAHHSILCFIDEVPRYRRLRSSTALVLALVEKYLENVRTKKAGAALLAGDVLAHWPKEDALGRRVPGFEEAVEALLRQASSARFKAGRHSAVSAMNCLLRRDDLKPSDRKRVIACAKRIASQEGESSIGWAARVVLLNLKEDKKRRTKP